MIRVYAQRYWPGAGDVDDCWVLAAFMALHAVAPWLALPGVGRFRELAGKPDLPGPSGAVVDDAAKAIRALYPRLAIETSSTFSWPSFTNAVKSGRPASLTLRSGALPAALRYGFDGIHQVTVEWADDEWVLANPLDQPHSRGDAIAQKDLRAAVEGYRGDKVSAILMPTAAEAFTTHPLYAIALGEGKRAEYARQVAGARVALVPLEG
jgi:hypothetical protein